MRSQLVQARIIGQLHQTYILLEVPNGLWLLDQHIVHERILLERLRRAWEKAAIHVQEIIPPQMLEFTPAQTSLIQESLQQLAEFGLELEFFLGIIPSCCALYRARLPRVRASGRKKFWRLRKRRRKPVPGGKGP